MKSIKVMALAVLAAALVCGVGMSLIAEQKTVTWLHIWGAGTEKEQIAKSIAQFEAANPDVKVEEIILSSAGWQPKLIQMLSGDNPPDVFLWYPGPKTTALVDEGVLAPLAGMWDDYGVDYFIPAGLKEACAYEGEVWNLPWGYHPTIVVYNKHVFDDLGLTLPTTIAEFESICDTLQAAGWDYPIASAWKGLWRGVFPPSLLISSLGGADLLMDWKDLKIDFGDPTCREAYEIWKRWVENEYWYPDPRSRTWAEGLSIMLNNEAPMYIIGTYAVPMLEEAGWVLGQDFDAFLFPQENPDYPLTLFGPFDSWCMSAGAPHPVEAQRLLAFLATTGPQTMRAIYHGGMACNKFVTAYNSVGQMIQDAMAGGAVFRSITFGPFAASSIQQGTVIDFYDDPDIEDFIEKSNAVREQYLEETGS